MMCLSNEAGEEDLRGLAKELKCERCQSDVIVRRINQKVMVQCAMCQRGIMAVNVDEAKKAWESGVLE